MHGVRLHLLGELSLWRGSQPVRLPPGSQRLAAFLALRDRPVPRAFAAGTLWPEVTDQRAAASLRSALWRIGQACPELVTAGGPELSLGSEITVDVREFSTIAASARAGAALDASAIYRLIDTEGLLPGWPEDWLADDRERLRHLRVDAMEQLCLQLGECGRHGLAAVAGMAAIAAEPLRESAHRAVIRLHLAQGNRFEAVRHYRLLHRMLARELGVQPSPLTRAALDGDVPVTPR